MGFSLEKTKPYAVMIAALAIAAFCNYCFGELLVHYSHQGTEPHVAPTAFALAFGGIAVLVGRKLAEGTVIPANALYLMFGVALSIFTSPLLGVVVGILYFLAAAVLMKGGLDVDLKEFRRIALKVTLLSIVSLLITAFLFSGSMMLMGIPATGANLLGAIVASTDPAAVLPVLGSLYWATEQARSARDIAISESAGTDVTGALLVAAFIPSALSGSMIDLWDTGYVSLVSWESARFLGWQLVGGAFGGLVGYVLLEGYQRYLGKDEASRGVLAEDLNEAEKEKLENEKLAKAITDVIAFLVALGFSFGVASVLSGNVFLAAFLAGLGINVKAHFKHSRHVFNEKVEILLIPFIFVFGGMLVEFWPLVKYAPVGIVGALALIYPIRHFAVYLVLWSSPEKVKKFVASVRQVGAVAIALASGVVAKNIPGTDSVMAITALVAIVTLVVCTWRVKQVAIKTGLATEDEPLQAEPMEV